MVNVLGVELEAVSEQHKRWHMAEDDSVRAAHDLLRLWLPQEPRYFRCWVEPAPGFDVDQVAADGPQTFSDLFPDAKP